MIIRLPPATQASSACSTSTGTHDIGVDDEPDLNDEWDLRNELDKILDAKEETDDEDGPDWFFEEDEVRSTDPDYVFCPAPHRKQLLHIFTKHFCQHPLFPEQTGSFDSSEIRINAVREMYVFCHHRGLREVWGYMWTQWYAPHKWSLWARSTSPYISRLRTTMNVENFWKQLKHDFLHHLIRPRLDQLIWILCTKVVPTWMARAEVLDDDFCAGRSKALTTYQTYFKTEWKKLSAMTLSGRQYKTNVSTWQCNCGRQKYNAHCLCKHLVQAVPELPPRFWHQVIRRCTVPIYKHPALHAIIKEALPVVPEYSDVEEGSITDGDDHKWLGNAKLWTGGGGWRLLSTTEASARILGKRKERSSSVDHEEERSSRPYGSSDFSDGVGFDSDDDEQVCHESFVAYNHTSQILYQAERDEQDLERLAEIFINAAKIIKSQAPLRNHIWANSTLRCHNGSSLGHDVVDMVHDIQQIELSGHKRLPTWPRNKNESRISRNTMGYHLRPKPLRPSSSSAS